MSLSLQPISTSIAISPAQPVKAPVGVLGFPYLAYSRENKILTVAHKSFSGSEYLTGVRWGTPSKPSEAGVLASARTGLGSAAGDLTLQYRCHTALGTRSNGLQAAIRPKCGAVKFIRRTLGK